MAVINVTYIFMYFKRFSFGKKKYLRTVKINIYSIFLKKGCCLKSHFIVHDIYKFFMSIDKNGMHLTLTVI